MSALCAEDMRNYEDDMRNAADDRSASYNAWIWAKIKKKNEGGGENREKKLEGGGELR